MMVQDLSPSNAAGSLPSLPTQILDQKTIDELPASAHPESTEFAFVSLKPYSSLSWAELQRQEHSFCPTDLLDAGSCVAAGSQDRITEHPGLEGTHEDHWVQLLAPRGTSHESNCMLAMFLCSFLTIICCPLEGMYSVWVDLGCDLV